MCFDVIAHQLSELNLVMVVIQGDGRVDRVLELRLVQKTVDRIEDSGDASIAGPIPIEYLVWMISINYNKCMERPLRSLRCGKSDHAG